MIIFRDGDIFESFCDVICHQVNCMGKMGSGIAKEIRERFPSVYFEFKKSFNASKNKLGNIDVVDVCDGERYVVNMYAQESYLPRGINHTNYSAFEQCLQKIKEHFYDKRKEISIGFPSHIGCGLGGGDWNIILSLIEQAFEGNDWSVEIWKLN